MLVVPINFFKEFYISQDKLNEILAKDVAVDSRSLDDPHVKTNLLLQVM